MRDSRRYVNWAFAGVVGLLAIAATLGVYRNRGRQPIAKAAPASTVSGSALPENHPPIDRARQLVVSLCTNRTFLGRGELRIRDFRPRFHDAAVGCLTPSR